MGAIRCGGARLTVAPAESKTARLVEGIGNPAPKLSRGPGGRALHLGLSPAGTSTLERMWKF
jgi:hypothetical protein